MNLSWHFWIGLIAAICITVYTLPQLISIIRTKNTYGVSLAMFLIMIIGSLLFFINGLATIIVDKNCSAGIPLVVANFSSSCSASLIIFYKIRNMSWAKKFHTTEEEIVKNWYQYKNQVKNEQKPIC